MTAYQVGIRRQRALYRNRSGTEMRACFDTFADPTQKSLTSAQSAYQYSLSWQIPHYRLSIKWVSHKDIASLGREFFYKPGSWYRIDDRTGFCTRAERTQSEWQGLIVEKRVWEIRQPQDFVRGVNDDQTVPYARPRSPNPTVGLQIGAQFQVYGDLPAEVCFEVQAGKINVFKASSIVTAASYHKSF